MTYLVTLLTISFLTFSAFSQAEDDTAPVTIRFSHVSDPGSPKHKGALMFRKLVTERLQDRVVVEIYPQGTLYNDTDGIEALRNNKIQMMAPSLAKFSAYTDVLKIFDLPFLFDSPAAVDKFQQRPKGRKLLLSMLDKNLVGLAYWHNGMKQLSAKKPLKMPQDAAGLIFRIQNSDVLISQFKALDASSLVLPYTQMFAALSDGRAQGAENPWANFNSQNLQEVQPYVTETNHGVLDYMLVTNSRFWYSIPHDVRYELEQIITEVTYLVNQTANAENTRHKNEVLASGKTQLITLTGQQRAAWKERMRPVWKQFEEQIGQRLIRSAEMANGFQSSAY